MSDGTAKVHPKAANYAPAVASRAKPKRPSQLRKKPTFVRTAAVGLHSLDQDTQRIPAHYQDTVAIDTQRKHLLQDARGTSPLSLCFRLDKLKRTVLPRMVAQPLVWLTFATYGVVASLARSGVHAPDFDSNVSLNQVGVLVTFKVVFFVGYCYNRHYAQYESAMNIKNCIFDCLCIATSYLEQPPPAPEVNEELFTERDGPVWDVPGQTPPVPLEDELPLRRLWRYLNLAHVTGYCGLTPAFNNLFDEFAARQGLLPYEPERERLVAVNIDHGTAAYHECTVWAMRVLAELHTCGAVTDHTAQEMRKQVLKMRRAISSLYAFQFQVIPFIYTHMISLTVGLYLQCYAATRALLFTPDSDYAFGIVFPLLIVMMITLATIGLVEVGATMSNPFGVDAEDFAVFTFLLTTVQQSRKIVETPTRTELVEHFAATAAAQRKAAAGVGGAGGTKPPNGDVHRGGPRRGSTWKTWTARTLPWRGKRCALRGLFRIV